MNVVTEIVFWFLLFLPFHSYLFYPFIIYLICSLKKEKIAGSKEYGVSVLISAYNEEKVIRDRIKNLSDAKKKFGNMEVLIGSDKSEDKTNQILDELQHTYPWLRVVFFNERRGKAAVLNDLVKLANNEILVFSDANTLFGEDAILLLTSHFGDSTVGGVSGRLILHEPETEFNKSVEEKRYWEYETFIKRNEGGCGVLIGANGGIFAIRKSLYREIPVTDAVTDDLFISLSVLDKNYNFTYENEAVAYEEVGREIIHEYRRKIRFASTNFQTLIYFKNLLIHRNVLLSYAFWSHKVTRWFFPHIYPLILILNIVLLQQNQVYPVVLILQGLFFLLAAAGYLVSKLKLRIGLITLPYFFLLTNVALISGFVKFLRGSHSIIWDSTPR